MEQIHNYVIADGDIIAAKDYNSPQNGLILYEVIRLINGTYLFLDDHLERLNDSAQIAGVQLPLSKSDLRQHLADLWRMNQVMIGNVKLILQYQDNVIRHFALYFIHHHYPSPEDYHNGVATILFRAERTNPNAKIIQQLLRERINQAIAKELVYEAILIHPEGFITEGSRSNFFMIRNGTVLTAPESDILPGITRKYVIKICQEQAIPFMEERIKESQLHSMEATFLSGTSPKILPVAKIDYMVFPAMHPIMNLLMSEYDKIIEAQVNKH